MDRYMQTDPWCIVEDGFRPDKQLASERIFSLANGYIGLRANFEEYYSGNTDLGSYIAGVYYQNDSNESEAQKCPNRLLNTPNWSGITVRLNDEILDLATWEVISFKRTLNMREGSLERSFEVASPGGHKIQVKVKRFLSLAETEIGAINYSVKSLDFEGRISFMPVIDANVRRPDVNDNEQLWNVLQIRTQQDVSYLWAHARRMNFQFCGALSYVLYKNNEQVKVIPTKIEKERIAGFSIGTDVKAGDTVYLNKYIAVADSLIYPRQNLPEQACELALNARKKGWNKLFEEHTAAWAVRWSQLDVDTEGSIEEQQAVLHNIFMNNIAIDI
jgi:maltose phosphorylase